MSVYKPGQPLVDSHSSLDPIKGTELDEKKVENTDPISVKHSSTSLEFDIKGDLKNLIGSTDAKIENAIETEMVIKFRLSNSGPFKISDGDIASKNLANLVYLIFSKLLGTSAITPGDKLPDNKAPKYSFASTRKSVSVYSHLLDYFKYLDSAKVYQDLNGFPPENNSEALNFKIDLINFLANPKNQLKLNEILFNTGIVARGGIYLGYTADIKHRGSPLLSKNVLFDGFIKSCAHDFEKLDVYERLESVASSMANSGKSFAEIADFFTKKYFTPFITDLANEIIINVAEEWGAVDDKKGFLFVTQSGIARAINVAFIGRLYKDGIFKMYQKYVTKILENLRKKQAEKNYGQNQNNDSKTSNYNDTTDAKSDTAQQSTTQPQRNPDNLEGSTLQGPNDSGIVAGAGVTALLNDINRDVENQKAVDNAAQKAAEGAQTVEGNGAQEIGASGDRYVHSTSHIGPLPDFGTRKGSIPTFADGTPVTPVEDGTGNFQPDHEPPKFKPLNSPIPSVSSGQTSDRTGELPAVGGIPDIRPNHGLPAFGDGSPAIVQGDDQTDLGNGYKPQGAVQQQEKLSGRPEFAGLKPEPYEENLTKGYDPQGNFQPPESGTKYKGKVEEAQSAINQALNNPEARRAIDSANPGANPNTSISPERQAAIIQTFTNDVNSGKNPQEAILAAIRKVDLNPSVVAPSVILAMINQALPNINPNQIGGVLALINNSLNSAKNPQNTPEANSALNSASNALNSATPDIATLARDYVPSGGGQPTTDGRTESGENPSTEAGGGSGNSGGGSGNGGGKKTGGGGDIGPGDKFDDFYGKHEGDIGDDHTKKFLEGDSPYAEENSDRLNRQGDSEIVKAITIAIMYCCQRGDSIFPLFTREEAKNNNLTYRFVEDDIQIRVKIINLVNKKVGYLAPRENGFDIDSAYYQSLFQTAKNDHNNKYYKPEKDEPDPELPSAGSIPPYTYSSTDASKTEGDQKQRPNRDNGSNSDGQGDGTNPTGEPGSQQPGSSSEVNPNAGGGGSSGGQPPNNNSGASSNGDGGTGGNSGGGGWFDKLKGAFTKEAIKAALASMPAWLIPFIIILSILAGVIVIGVIFHIYCKPVKEYRDKIETAILMSSIALAPTTFGATGVAAIAQIGNGGESAIRKAIDSLEGCKGGNDCETPGAVSGGSGVKIGVLDCEAGKYEGVTIPPVDDPATFYYLLYVMKVESGGDPNKRAPGFCGKEACIGMYQLPQSEIRDECGKAISGGYYSESQSKCVSDYLAGDIKTQTRVQVSRLATRNNAKYGRYGDAPRKAGLNPQDPSSSQLKEANKFLQSGDIDGFIRAIEAVDIQNQAYGVCFLSESNLSARDIVNRGFIGKIPSGATPIFQDDSGRSDQTWAEYYNTLENCSRQRNGRPFIRGAIQAQLFERVKDGCGPANPANPTNTIGQNSNPSNLPKYSYSKDPSSPFSQIPTRKLIEMAKMSLAETDYLESVGGYNFGINRVAKNQKELEQLKIEENQKLAEVAPVTAYIKGLVEGVKVEAEGSNSYLDWIPYGGGYQGVDFKGSGGKQAYSFDSSGGWDITISVPGSNKAGGTPILAHLDGEIIGIGQLVNEYSTSYGSYGNVVRVFYPSLGLTAEYGHLDQIGLNPTTGRAWQRGDIIETGNLIGTQGSSGSSRGTNLLSGDKTWNKGGFIHVSLQLYSGRELRSSKLVEKIMAFQEAQNMYGSFVKEWLTFQNNNIEAIKSGQYQNATNTSGSSNMASPMNPDCPVCGISGGAGTVIAGVPSIGKIYISAGHFLDPGSGTGIGNPGYSKNISYTTGDGQVVNIRVTAEAIANDLTAEVFAEISNENGIPAQIVKPAKSEMAIGLTEQQIQDRKIRSAYFRRLKSSYKDKGAGVFEIHYDAINGKTGYLIPKTSFNNFDRILTTVYKDYQSTRQLAATDVGIGLLEVDALKPNNPVGSSIISHIKGNITASEFKNTVRKQYGEKFKSAILEYKKLVASQVQSSAPSETKTSYNPAILALALPHLAVYGKKWGENEDLGVYQEDTKNSQNDPNTSQNYIESFAMLGDALVSDIWGGIEVRAETGSKPTDYKSLSDGHKSFLSQIAKGRGYPGPYQDAKGLNPGLQKAFDDMQQAAKNSGFDIYILSGYRSYDEQVKTYFGGGDGGSKINKFWSEKMTDIERKEVEKEYLERAVLSAPPGYSEHHTGLAIDIQISGKTDLNNETYSSELYNWLKSNAKNFGFTQSYTGASGTGAGEEKWHWRWDGTQITNPSENKYPNNNPLTLTNSTNIPAQNTSNNSGPCQCPDGRLVLDPSLCVGPGGATGAPGSGKFGIPASGPFTSPYGWRWGRMHRGIDIGSPTGTPVYASDGGTVVFAGWNDGGYGQLIEIDHNNGYKTKYAHLSKIGVKVGQSVNQGDLIGEVGSTGRSTGPHLHFEIIKGGGAVDPCSPGYIVCSKNLVTPFGK